jgi:hypothetical protein
VAGFQVSPEAKVLRAAGVEDVYAITLSHAEA